MLSLLQINDPTVQNTIVTQQNIYIIRAQQRRNELGLFTFIQAFVNEFKVGDWVYELQKDSKNLITHLFFTKGPSLEILTQNHEILIMDCTYKTVTNLIFQIKF